MKFGLTFSKYDWILQLVYIELLTCFSLQNIANLLTKFTHPKIIMYTCTVYRIRQNI